MRILLATYNYYPYNFGGSEVYVNALAQFLKTKGHDVTVVAAIPEEAFDDHEAIYADDSFKICAYTYNNIPVWGIKYYELSLPHIYEKMSAQHEKGWINFFNGQPKFDLLHINGFTATIGIDLMRALKQTNPRIRVITSYHTAISCPKGTLLYANTNKECYVKASKSNCTACIISEKLHLPIHISKVITAILPETNNKNLPAARQVKTLINKAVNSFDELEKHTDKWVVYSSGIKNVLQSNCVPEQKIVQFRHGLSNEFLDNSTSERSPHRTDFLFSGRLDVIKGFKTLMQAWLKLPVSQSRTLYITAKPESFNPTIKKLIQQAQVRNDVQFLGPLDQQALIELYRKIHCVIIPSECFEIGPLVFHEAISQGCNVISSNIGGCRELGNYYSNQHNFFTCGNPAHLKLLIENFTYQPVAEQMITSVTAHNNDILETYKTVLAVES